MDERILFTLIEKFNTGQIAELDLTEGNLHLVLRKTPQTPAGTSISGTAQTAAAAPLHHALSPVIEQTGEGTEIITSPMVAAFYSAANPDAPPFVTAGSQVKTGQTLCVLEAMKMMNKLEAEFDCEIVNVKASNGDMVEYGQALFEVKRL
jgi:acetyl-CoA carboxylase biotin carboxyl carrier protein